MNHYVCTGGCLTVQETKGFCTVVTCIRYRNPLSPCDCTDGTHADWLYRNHPDPEAAKKAAKRPAAKLPPKSEVTPESEVEPDILEEAPKTKDNSKRKTQMSKP